MPRLGEWDEKTNRRAALDVALVSLMRDCLLRRSEAAFCRPTTPFGTGRKTLGWPLDDNPRHDAIGLGCEIKGGSQTPWLHQVGCRFR